MQKSADLIENKGVARFVFLVCEKARKGLKGNGLRARRVQTWVHTEKHGWKEPGMEMAGRRESRDGGSQTQDRVADGYSVVKTKCEYSK